MEMIKEIEIGEQKYRVGRFSARIGSWLLKLASKGERLTEEEHANIQNHCLSVCSRLDGGAYLPVMVNGQFAVKDLEYDLSAVTKLQAQTMSHNFDSFLAERVAEMKKLAEDLSSSNSTPSTPTSSGQ